MAQTILYYPKININDGVWLRNALLYWDEISSIVPYERYAELSHELQYLQSLDVYHPIYPQGVFFSEFSDDFCKCIIRRVERYEDSIAYNSNTICGKRQTVQKDTIYAPNLQDLIHYNKIPYELLQIFKEKRFISDVNSNGWLEIDSRIASIYMRTLAEYSIKCSNKDIVLGTDTVTNNKEIYRVDKGSEQVKNQCCKINIEKCLPRPALDVSYDDILQFKHRRKDELEAFRMKIRELEANIYHSDSLEMIRHYEEQFIEEWQQSSSDFYKVLKEAKIKFYMSSLITLVGIPFVGQVLSEYIGPIAGPIIQNTAPMINVGIGYYDYRKKISPAKSDGGFSYIIKANDDGIIQM